jgi:DNA-binding GntR family transcriptional regulator
MEQNFKVAMNEYLPLRDVVFNTLRQAILRGELKPGERLMEIQLANKLGVSRTPVREAIRKLELEGLVHMMPRKGAEVADITEKSLKDVLEVRRALEELAVQLACDKITENEIRELREAAKEFEQIASATDVTRTAEADVKFHDIIYMTTDNQKLITLLNHLREQMYRYRVEYLKREEVYPTLFAEHEEIIRHLEAREKENAAKIVCRHIDNQVSAVLGVIRTNHQSQPSE